MHIRRDDYRKQQFCVVTVLYIELIPNVKDVIKHE